MSKATCPICSKEFSQRKITVSSSEIQNFVTIELTFIQSLFVTNQKQIYYPKTIQLTFYFHILLQRHVNQCIELQALGIKNTRSETLASRDDIYDRPEWRLNATGVSPSDNLRSALVRGSLDVEGFLELLNKTTTNSLRQHLKADGLVQICVHGLESSNLCTSPLPKTTAKSISIYFDGEEHIVQMKSRSTMKPKDTIWKLAAAEPHTITFIVKDYYGPSTLKFCLTEKNQVSLPGLCCFGCSSNNVNVVSKNQLPCASITLHELNNASRSNSFLLPVYDVNHETTHLFVRVWIRFVADVGLSKQKAFQLLKKSINAGDATSVGLFCRMKTMSKHLRTNHGFDAFDYVVQSFRSTLNHDNNNNDNNDNGAVPMETKNTDATVEVVAELDGDREKEEKEEKEEREEMEEIEEHGSVFECNRSSAFRLMLQTIMSASKINLLYHAVEISRDSELIIQEVHARSPESIEHVDETTGKTPFLLACSLGKLCIAKYLATQGIRIARKPVLTLNNSSALQLACKNGGHVVEWLIEKEANPNATNDNGDTVLSLAVGYKDDTRACQMITLLIEAGANVQLNTFNDQGDSVIHVAAR